jgi:hypothetical protein
MRHGRLKSLPTMHHGACVFLLRRGRVKYATIDTSWTRCAPVRARIFVRILVSSFFLRGLNQMQHYNSPAPLALTPAPLALTSPRSHSCSYVLTLLMYALTLLLLSLFTSLVLTFVDWIALLSLLLILIALVIEHQTRKAQVSSAKYSSYLLFLFFLSKI